MTTRPSEATWPKRRQTAVGNTLHELNLSDFAPLPTECKRLLHVDFIKKFSRKLPYCCDSPISRSEHVKVPGMARTFARHCDWASFFATPRRDEAASCSSAGKLVKMQRFQMVSVALVMQEGRSSWRISVGRREFEIVTPAQLAKRIRFHQQGLCFV